jgi:DNA-binding response OmpR family regulator
MPASDADTIKELRERIVELEEEVRQLRADMVPIDATFLGFLTRNETTLLMGIYKREIANYAYLDRITENPDKYSRYTDINHESLRARVSVWKLRKKMRMLGIEIKTWRGIGYYLDDENKAKLKALMEEKK